MTVIRFDDESRIYSIIATIFSFFVRFLVPYLVTTFILLAADYLIGKNFRLVGSILIGSLVMFYVIFFLVDALYDKLRKDEIMNKTGEGFIKIGDKWYYYKEISYCTIFDYFSVFLADPKLYSVETEFSWL